MGGLGDVLPGAGGGLGATFGRLPELDGVREG